MMIPRLAFFSLLTLALAPSRAGAETVKASLAAVRGDVTINGAKPPEKLPAPVKVGSIVKPAVDSGAILIPVPGQTVFVDQKTVVELKSCDLSAGANAAWNRHSAFTLKSGHLHCSIAHPKSGASNLEVITPKVTLSAQGTSWATWSDTSGTHAAVFAGVVTIRFGDADIEVLYGQVASVTGEGDAAVLEILDLKTGRYVRYTKGQPGQPGLATAAQIKVARDFLEEGFGAFHGTASEEDLLAFSQIVAQINQVLLANLLPPINPSFEWQLWPDWDKLVPLLLPLASPEKPIN